MSGSHVGVVQVLNRDVHSFSFRVNVECGPGTCLLNSSIPILIAVTGISVQGEGYRERGRGRERGGEREEKRGGAEMKRVRKREEGKELGGQRERG